MKHFDLFQANFEWANCGSSRDPFRVEKLQLTPTNIHFPENLGITASAMLQQNISAPVHVSIKSEITIFETKSNLQNL